MTEAKILGVKVNNISKKEVLEKIGLFLLSDSSHYIVTLNPEMVVETQHNEYFKNIINKADISIADGTGIIFAAKFLQNINLPERIRGVDLICDICSSQFIKGKNIYLIGGREGAAKRSGEILSDKYANLNVVGAEEGIPPSIFNVQYSIFNKFRDKSNNDFPIFNYDDYQQINAELISRINETKPEILFVAFGAPKQETWIYENLKKMPSVKLAIGVGGSFDFISGKIRRAPKFMQNTGLEWLWRLAKEPKRIGRIYNATFKFVYLVLRNKKEGD